MSDGTTHGSRSPYPVRQTLLVSVVMHIAYWNWPDLKCVNCKTNLFAIYGWFPSAGAKTKKNIGTRTSRPTEMTQFYL